MRILPELEAYRDRLVERCAAWPETAAEMLLSDLHRTLEQADLLDKGIRVLRDQIDADPSANAERLRHRMAVQEQMRDLTRAYAEVLKRHIEGIEPLTDRAEDSPR